MDSSSLLTLMIGFGVVAVVGLIIGWAMWESSKSDASASRHEPASRPRIYVDAEEQAAGPGYIRTTSGTIRTVAGSAAPYQASTPYPAAAAPPPYDAPPATQPTYQVPAATPPYQPPAPAQSYQPPATTQPYQPPAPAQSYQPPATTQPAYATPPPPAPAPPGPAPTPTPAAPAPPPARQQAQSARPPAPAPAAPAPAYTTTPRAPQTTVFRLGRILWVDDQPDSHVPDVVALHRMGLTVTVATHCETALAYLAAEKYLLVVTDQSREGDTMSTAEFIQTVRRTYPGIPTVAYEPGAALTGPEAAELPHDHVVTGAGELPSAIGRILGR